MGFFAILLVIHIAGGSISLLLGLYILGRPKGNKTHRLLGTIYFYALLTSTIISLFMAYLHPNYFLFIIGVLTSYLLLTGKRYINKKGTIDVRPADWLLTGLILVFGLAFIGFGVYNLLHGNSFGTVMIVFGAVSLFFVFQDIKNFMGRSTIANFGLTTHLQRMVGSYIASATAFIVVNNKILPGIAAWLLPGILLAPLIVYWTKKYRLKAAK
jgi:uncharacterized membrane protein